MSSRLLRVLQQRVRGIPRTPREVNYSLQALSVMRTLGWHRSLHSGHPVDKDGSPIPWYTYAALEWLAPRVKRTDVVFEFGAGYSTVWFGQHAKEVITVEHDREWLEKVRDMVDGNVTLLHRTTPGSEANVEGDSPYFSSLLTYAPKSFDVVVVDGMERVQCAYAASSRVCDDGIIIFDNSEREPFRAGIEYLHKQGFGRIDFYGFISQVGTRNCTSIFSRFGTRWTTEDAPLVFQGW